MKLNPKIIFIIVIAIILLAILLWPKGGYKIAKVIDGSTIELNNGTTVRLIGITNTEEAKKELESLEGENVTLQSDRSANFDSHKFSGSEVVYAYVLLDDNSFECINATILKKGLADLVEGGCLQDSLIAFQEYAKQGGGTRKKIPTPIVQKIEYKEDNINLPQFTPQAKRRYQNWYADGNMNIDMLKEACDYNLPYTKMFANQLAARAEGEFSIEQVCEIFEYCYKKWRYVNDPKGQEYVSRASESIAGSLTGDCDDFAVLMASCILACGGDACIVDAYGENSGHAYAEVDINSFRNNKSTEHIKNVITDKFSAYNPGIPAIREANGHRWLNLDWQAAYPGGPYYQAAKRNFYSIVDGVWCWNQNNS